MVALKRDSTAVTMRRMATMSKTKVPVAREMIIGTKKQREQINQMIALVR
jgi:hypothetical protein